MESNSSGKKKFTHTRKYSTYMYVFRNVYASCKYLFLPHWHLNCQKSYAVLIIFIQLSEFFDRKIVSEIVIELNKITSFVMKQFNIA